ncbi:Cys-tRNA(Pro) deacylase [Bacillus siamensis]|uniref:Cys-tRNA(Pro)/Cys-tRNA(Cys) deacylase n=1 Tax=Bacillus siamensis TaxID=659243 RepID=A0AAI8MZX0_9BACI|nr:MULTISPECIES: Cys-tRNA(Pro) deacylase [Bacillus]AME08023.1 aminoacyl-tRNA deacylase [Bacillus sp. SDLI1]AUJ76888.1 Cys-tRNA(Pro) deacylase [Bacillus siamensis]UUA85181.1 Cys-tRNA(Pro) deacylase [Bacillus siamensis]
MAKKTVKTNAVRIIEQQNISYELLSYKTDGGQPADGLSVSEKIGYPAENVYKTLVTSAGTERYYVFVVPVAKELNLKKAAKSAGEKKIEMIAMKDLLRITGYMRGGCSPIGMKKWFPTFIDKSAETLEFMIVSAGKIGLQVKLAPQDLAAASRASFTDIV